MSDQPLETAATAAPSSPGRALAAARQARGMTVTEVALRLKFSPRKIEALETDRFDALPGPTIVRGMIRSYAKLVGLDAKPLVEALHQQQPGDLADVGRVVGAEAVRAGDGPDQPTIAVHDRVPGDLIASPGPSQQLGI